MKNIKQHRDKPIGKVKIIKDTLPHPDQLIKKIASKERTSVILSKQATNIVQAHISDYGSTEAVIESALQLLHSSNRNLQHALHV